MNNKAKDWLDLMREKLDSKDASIPELMALLKADQLTKTIQSSVINTWEDFIDLLVEAFGNFEEDLDEPFWEFQNFFPSKDEKNKDVGEGAWIKVPTDIGFNVYYAKRTKKQFNKTNIERKLEKLEREADKVSLQVLESLEASQSRVTLITKELKLRAEIIELAKELKRASMLEVIGMQPYCIKYQVSKTKWVTLLPYQYELAHDIELYVNTIVEIGKTEALTYRSIFSGLNSDAVFYLQSRGISKDVAIMMTKLRDCFFIFDTAKAMQQVYGKISLKAA